MIDEADHFFSIKSQSRHSPGLCGYNKRLDLLDEISRVYYNELIKAGYSAGETCRIMSKYYEMQRIHWQY